MGRINESKIKCVIEDLVTDFLYYDRKEDEDLPLNTIEEVVKNGEITKEEIVNVLQLPLIV